MATLSQGIRCSNQNSGHALHEITLQYLPFEPKSLVVWWAYKIAKRDYYNPRVSTSFHKRGTTRFLLDGFS